MTNGARLATRFVLVIGIVNLFADMTYEGARGVLGAFLGHLGASAFAVGAVAGGAEFAGYAIRSVSGVIADRTGKYWIEAWIGYAINMLCVPALALAGSWPVAAGLMFGERLGRGIRRPVIAAVIARAGREIGGGHAFGLNELLDQIGATAGPLIVAFAVARGGYTIGFGILLIPALLTLSFFAAAAPVGKRLTPRADESPKSGVSDPAAFRRYAIGGAITAAGFVDFALIAYHFQRDHVLGVAAISVVFACAMAAGALAAPLLGRLFDRFGQPVVGYALATTAAATAMAFLGSGFVAEVGAAVWGVGVTVQDALLLTLVATVLKRGRSAGSFGLYDLIFGVGWFVGSSIAGALLDRSITGLVIFSVATQLIAIPFFLSGPRQKKVGTLNS